MLLAHPKKDNLTILFLFFVIAYAYGILSPEHYNMLGNSFYLGFLVTTLFAVATFFGLRGVSIERIGTSTLTWLGFLFIIFIQPFIHEVPYPDFLILPFGLFLLSALLSVVAVNVPTDKRMALIHGLAWLLLVVGLLSAGTQFVQLFFPNSFSSVIAQISPIGRPYSNMAQPNQASFVNVLAIVSAFYLYHHHHTQKNKIKYGILLATAFFLLVVGISLSMSRAGLILLAVAILGGVFYAWASHKQRFFVTITSIILAVIAYQLGVWLLVNVFPLYQGGTGAGRLVAHGIGLRQVLWDRAWFAFASNPITGVGYDNYLMHGLQHIERWDWFETADNSHNVISHIAAEYGLLGLATLIGVVSIFIKQLILFFKKQLSSQDLFLCLVLSIFVLFSFSEFPLWYPVCLFPFVLFVGLLDKGITFKRFDVKRLAMGLAVMVALVSAVYTGVYRANLQNHATVLFYNVDNQQKIDAYRDFTNMFGFRKTKEYLLYQLVDEEKNENTEQLIEMGDRLMIAFSDMEIARVQVRLLMRAGKQEEADKLNRRLCVWEHQHAKQCDRVVEQILALDPDDKMGYAKRLNEWYNDWLPTRKRR